eukprot:m.1256171 g.1256171  ORF g.1256171 m.1256171 type:complete len:157 (+) comp24710_c1_seq55:270-740(+)
MNGSADAVSVSQKTLNVTVEEAGESLWGRLRANSRSHRTAPIHEGVLWKRRINKGRFEQVFVCLFQDRLIWYNVDDAAKRVRRELGGCLLLGALVSRKLTVHGRNNFRNGGYFALLDEDLHGFVPTVVLQCFVLLTLLKWNFFHCSVANQRCDRNG